MKLFMDNKGTTGVILEQGDVTVSNSFLIIAAVSALIVMIISIVMICAPDYMHAEGVIPCPKCGSHETTGLYTFWSNDGNIVNGSMECNLDHADYSYFNCDYCGHSWKVYRSEWVLLGY